MILSLTMSGEVLFDGFERKNSDEKHRIFWNTFQDLVQWSSQAIGWWIILSFKPLKVNSCNCSAQSHTVPCQHTFLAKMFWNVSPEQMTGVLGYRNLDWVSSYFHSRICGRKLFDILRPQRWRCTERQNVITAPPHSRRPLDGGQWMTCWQAESSRNLLDGEKRGPFMISQSSPLHLMNACSTWSLWLQWPKLQAFRGRHATWWYSEWTTWGCFGNLHAGSQVIETLGS